MVTLLSPEITKQELVSPINQEPKTKPVSTKKSKSRKIRHQRGKYKEILLYSLSPYQKKIVDKLVTNAAKADKVDEHGNWEFGADFNRKGQGYATNWSLYGIGKDIHSKRWLIVIQIRQYISEKADWFPTIRKSYFLVGRNEDNTTFAHPVESRVIHSAIRKDKDVIKACQDWMFGCDYRKVLRQGDIALIPYHVSKKVIEDGREIDPLLLIQNSHALSCDRLIRYKESLIAFQPSLVHLPQTHPAFNNIKGWYKIMISKRVAFHDFAAPTVD